MDITLIKELVDYGVIGFLGLMGFIALWAYFERLLFFSKIDLKKYRFQEELENDLSENLTLISSIASNAPYVGLLGTVLGIIITFYLLGESGQMDASSIMKSLSLALKATALGLVVAIPSMMFYNHLTRRVEVLINQWKIIKKS